VYLSENAEVSGDLDCYSRPAIGQGARRSFLRLSVDDALPTDPHVVVVEEEADLRVA
jgi:hypothetical protein